MKRYAIIISLLTLFFVNAAASDSIPLTLQQCKDRALLYNEDLRSADIDVQMARQDRKIALSQYIPKINGLAMGVMLPVDFPLIDENYLQLSLKTHGMYMAGFTLMEPLYAGGRIVNGTRLAKQGVECMEIMQKKTKAEVEYNVENAFWSLVAVRTKRQMVEQYIMLMDTIENQVNIAYETEHATMSDLLSVRSKKMDLQYQLKQIDMGIDLCALSLMSMIGVSADSMVVPVYEFSETDSITNSEVSDGERLEETLLRKQVEISKLQEKMVLGEYLPTLGLTAGWMWFDNFNIYTALITPFGTWDYTYKMGRKIPMAMLSLSVPITGWVEGAHKLKKAKLQTEKSQLSFEKNSKLLKIENEQALRQVQNGSLMYDAAKMKKESAEEKLRVERNRYGADMCTLSDVMRAQAECEQALSEYIETAAKYRIYIANYKRIFSNQ